MGSIVVNHVNKVYTYYKKQQGLVYSFKNMFHREELFKEAVKDVSFEVNEGEIVGFIGPNGAGKTTTLKMLAGILYPTSGEISINGYTPWKRDEEFKRQFSIVMGQKNQLWWDLPASESFALNQAIYGIERQDYQKRLGELCELLDVSDLLDVQVRRLSLGERMKMELIASLLHQPKVVLLDEPTIGLDLISQRSLRNFLKYYNKQFKPTIILTSHYMNDIEDLCNRAIIINHGTIVYDGDIKDIKDSVNPVKIIKLKLREETKVEQLQAFGTIKECDGVYVSIEVKKEQANEMCSSILNVIKPLDFTMEDISLEQSISMLYQTEVTKDEKNICQSIS